MAEHPRITLADYLQATEIEDHILVEEEDSVRDDWWRASCGLHDWYTTGSKPNVEDAAAHHVAWEHTACAAVDPDSPADALLYCRMLPDHSGDHFNGGRSWASERESAATADPSGAGKERTAPVTGNASHYFATDSDRRSFLGYFGNVLDAWFTPEFADYVRSGERPATSRIPDVCCPKCGHVNVSIRHCFGGEGSFTPDDRCRLGDPQHFHRRCGRCSYRWRTNETPLDVAPQQEGDGDGQC